MLYPLNQLKKVHPDLFEKEASKYHGREFILQQKLPKLQCLWNDVLHFSAVHPLEVKQALIKAGSSDFTRQFYQVNPSLLETERTVVYLYKYEDSETEINEKNMMPYDPNNIEVFSKLPDETRAYYEEEISMGNDPLLYHLVPHILYKGSLNTSDLAVITV